MTAAYFALTFILIFLGLGSMRKMLKIAQEKTLSRTGNIPLRGTDVEEATGLTDSNNIPLVEYYPAENKSPSGGGMSESVVTDSSIDLTTNMPINDLRNVVEIMNNISAKKLHEPYGSQLNMKDAVAISRTWIDEMYHNSPEYFGIELSENYKMVRVELYENSLGDFNFEVLREYCSFWYIEYKIHDFLDLRLYINAVTGKVLKARIVSYIEIDFTEYNNEVLDAYLYAFAKVYGLRDEDFSGEVVSSEGNQAPFECLSIAGGKLYLILETGRASSVEPSYMNIYFSTMPKEGKVYDVITDIK